MRNKRLYITLGDEPTGVYQSQVTDVCLFLNSKFKADIGLLSLISIRKFFKNRKKIKKWFPNAVVIPMVPKKKNWRLNLLSIYIILKLKNPVTVICRNPLATNLAIRLRDFGVIKYVIYDGRGAIAAEWLEYNEDQSPELLNEISGLEQNAVLKSDYMIAISNKLVEYWVSRYDYNKKRHVIIPCTLSISNNGWYEATRNNALKKKLNIANNDIVFVYAGSTAGWQSFELMKMFLIHLLNGKPNYKVLFLSKEDDNNQSLMKLYPHQILRRWVKPEEVHDFLSLCDYGLLIREKTVTNNVASPTKFAEYLKAGLSIIISSDLGDYSEFVNNNNCGIIINNITEQLSITKPSNDIKDKNRRLAQRYFSKYSKLIIDRYRYIIYL